MSKPNPHAVALAKRRASKLTPARRAAIARMAAQARWRKPKAPGSEDHLDSVCAAPDLDLDSLAEALGLPPGSIHKDAEERAEWTRQLLEALARRWAVRWRRENS